MRYRMLVVDLDGTAVPFSGVMNERDLRAARALAAIGVTVSIATGRLFSGSVAVAHTLGVRGTIACVNGSQIADVDGANMEGDYLCVSSRARFRELVAAHRLRPFVLTEHEVHLAASDRRFRAFLSSWSEQMVEHDHDASLAEQLDRDDVLAVLASGAPDSVVAAQRLLCTLDGCEAVAFRDFADQRSFLKLRSGKADKGSALARLAADRGLAAEQCVCIGDWLNDVSMLSRAGHSFAMAHAGDEVRAVADEVLTADGERGGAIAEVAERVWNVTVA